MSDNTTPPPSDDALVRAYRHFKHPSYQRHNGRRLEHLASLGLELQTKTVLELGAGVGDLTTFFLDRDCAVVSVEPRPENCRIFADTITALGAAGYKGVKRSRLIVGGVESLDRLGGAVFDVVFCYGLLYHLSDPEAMLALMARRCTGLLLLETCVSLGSAEEFNPFAEPIADPTQAFDGRGCRPTRPWIFKRLRNLFAHVYVPRTQPAHEEFPLDWTISEPAALYTRAVFVASRTPLNNALLLEELPERQTAV